MLFVAIAPIGTYRNPFYDLYNDDDDDGDHEVDTIK
jgi:hypothetical protein